MNIKPWECSYNCSSVSDIITSIWLILLRDPLTTGTVNTNSKVANAVQFDISAHSWQISFCRLDDSQQCSAQKVTNIIKPHKIVENHSNSANSPGMRNVIWIAIIVNRSITADDRLYRVMSTELFASRLSNSASTLSQKCSKSFSATIPRASNVQGIGRTTRISLSLFCIKYIWTGLFMLKLCMLRSSCRLVECSFNTENKCR